MSPDLYLGLAYDTIYSYMQLIIIKNCTDLKDVITYVVLGIVCVAT